MAKFDTIGIKPEMDEIINSMPYEFTILYAPSWEKGEGLELVNTIRDFPFNLIIKYRPAPGKKEDLEKIPYVEELARETANVKVIPAEWDFLSVARYVDMLIADCSSTLVEFLPFGKSIQLMKKPKSKYIERIRIDKLKKFLKKLKSEKVKSYKNDKAVSEYFYKIDGAVSKRTADIVEEYLKAGRK